MSANFRNSWKRGLFVGVNEGSLGDRLKHADADARAMAKALEEYAGFGGNSVLVGSEATKEKILAEVYRMAAGPGLFAIYLAGHGGHKSGENEQYFAAHPASDEPGLVALFGEILKRIKEHGDKAATLLVILDICRDELIDQQARPRRLVSANLDAYVERVTKGIHQHVSPEAVFIYASPIGESILEYDQIGGSPLRHSLAGALSAGPGPMSVSDWFLNAKDLCIGKYKHNPPPQCLGGPIATRMMICDGKSDSEQLQNDKPQDIGAGNRSPDNQAPMPGGWKSVVINGYPYRLRLVTAQDIRTFRAWIGEADKDTVNLMLFPPDLEAAARQSPKLPSLNMSWPEIQAFANWTHWRLLNSAKQLPYPSGRRRPGWVGVRLSLFHEFEHMSSDAPGIQSMLIDPQYWLTTSQYRGRSTSLSDLGNNDNLDCGSHDSDRLVWELPRNPRSLGSLIKAKHDIGLALLYVSR